MKERYYTRGFRKKGSEAGSDGEEVKTAPRRGFVIPAVGQADRCFLGDELLENPAFECGCARCLSELGLTVVYNPQSGLRVVSDETARACPPDWWIPGYYPSTSRDAS